MAPAELPVQLSQPDTERFGVVIARARDVTLANLPLILKFCEMDAVKMLIARTDVAELGTVHEMERTGFLLMDTLVYYVRDVSKTPIPLGNAAILMRAMRVSEATQVRAIAESAFQGYFGHYHADPRLDRAKCDEGYAAWAANSVAAQTETEPVLVADRAGEIVGFATMRLNSPEETDGVLFAVALRAQREGVHRSLMIGALEWSRAMGAKRMVTSTQITNRAPQKSWARVGFEYSHAYYTFHKWFDSGL